MEHDRDGSLAGRLGQVRPQHRRAGSGACHRRRVAFAAISVSQLDFLGVPRNASLGGYFGAIFGIIPALVIGYPIHAGLMRMKWTHPAVYAGIGAGLAGISYLLAGFALGLLGPWND